jgi:hypothetical protein
MANITDEANPMTRAAVIEALKSERTYQVRRWGYRQSDGTLKEAPHDVFDFLCYIQHYNSLAIAEASTKPGNASALEMLRKVVTLAIAYYEQQAAAYHERHQDAKRVFDVYGSVRTDYFQVPDGAGVSFYLLKVQKHINNAIELSSRSNIESQIFAVIDAGISCFERFGVQGRDLSASIINGRDNLPA